MSVLNSQDEFVRHTEGRQTVFDVSGHQRDPQQLCLQHAKAANSLHSSENILGLETHLIDPKDEDPGVKVENPHRGRCEGCTRQLNEFNRGRYDRPADETTPGGKSPYTTRKPSPYYRPNSTNTIGDFKPNLPQSFNSKTTIGAYFKPTERIFTHTCGLDHRLWDKDEKLKPDVRKYIMQSINVFWGPRYRNWSEWARIYFAGSEASEWTSESLEGNSDFDVLVGVDYDKFRENNPSYASLSNEQITNQFNAEFRHLNSDHVWLPFKEIEDVKGVGVWHRSSNLISNGPSENIIKEEAQQISPERKGQAFQPFAEPLIWQESQERPQQLRDKSVNHQEPNVLSVRDQFHPQIHSRAGVVRQDAFRVDETTKETIISRESMELLSNNTTNSLSNKVGDVQSVETPKISMSITTMDAALINTPVVNVLEESFAPNTIGRSERLAKSLSVPLYVISDGQNLPELPSGYVWTGPWSRTTYVNQDSYDIKDIKPYAAYDVGANKWVVKPPHLPHWNINDFPRKEIAEIHAIDNYVRTVLNLPEPERTQQGAALFTHLHSDRSRAFSGRGEGWYDVANVVEKYLDQEGLWEELVGCAHRWKEGEGLAPADWSNTPPGYTASLEPDKIHRGFVAHGYGDGSEGEWDRESAKRLGNGTANLDDVMKHVVHKTPGQNQFWHAPHPKDTRYDLDDAKTYAETDAEDHPAHWIHEGRSGRAIGSVGVVFEGKKPHGWDPEENLPGGKNYDKEKYQNEGGDLMGHSSLPVGHKVELHAVHYTDENGDWHRIPAKGHHVVASLIEQTNLLDTVGRQEHPNVDHYRSGGMGHRPDDESKSVVGFMPTSHMLKYREHAGNWHPDSPKIVQGIKDDIQSGKGITNPIMVEYDHKNNWGYVGEGNHRLQAANEAGAKTVPVRVIRSSDLSGKRAKGIGAPMHLQTKFGEGRDEGYVPTDIHPYHFLIDNTKTASKIDDLYGSNDIHKLFGGSPVIPAPFPQANRSKSKKDYDPNIVARSMTHPHEFPIEDVDPRELHAMQPSITRPGVSHYMSPETKDTVFSPSHRPGNDVPRVYDREDGQRLLLSGHHRGTAALLKGEPLKAMVIRGPWGGSRIP